MNIANLRYVSEVQKSGSITKAAQNLYMGQPNLSKARSEEHTSELQSQKQRKTYIWGSRT